MTQDTFVECLLGAESLAEEGNMYQDKLILGMYRNYKFENHINLLVERVMSSDYHIISAHYWRYLGPVIQCDDTTAHLVNLLQDDDYVDRIPAICNALVTKDLSKHETVILGALSKFSDDESTENFIAICQLISRDTKLCFRDILIENSSKFESRINGIYYAEALGYQLSIEDLNLLPEIFAEEQKFGFRWRKIQHYGLTIAASILVERYIEESSLDRIVPWLSDPKLKFISVNIFGRLGSKESVSLLEKLFDEDDDVFNHIITVAISMLLQRGEIATRRKMKIEEQKGFEKIILKGGISGTSDTKFFNYYTGIDKKKILTTAQRRGILSEIYLTDFVFSSNEIPIRTSYDRGISHDKRLASLSNLLGNLHERQKFAARNISKKPWHPQGAYTYSILALDAKWLAEEFGGELGVYVRLIPTNIPGVFSFGSYRLNSLCNQCYRGNLVLAEDKLQCNKCHAIIPDSDARIEFEGIINSRLVESEGETGKYEYNGKKLTQKDLQSMLDAYPVIIDSQIPQLSDHLAAMYADIEEMVGIPGDPRKRKGLE